LAAKEFTGLLSLVEDYLKLNRSDKEMQGIRTRLLRREETLAVQVAEMLSKAKELRASCRFDAASKQLCRIPESQHSFEILELLNQCEELSAARTAAMSAIDAAITSEAYQDGLISSTAYRVSLGKLGLTDGKFQSRLSSCESGAAKSAARVRQQRLLLVLGSVTILCLVVIITAVRIRSARVEAAFAAAVARTDARVESARAEEVERIAVSDLALPPLRNSVGMELRLLPSGRFEMGEGSKTHQVTLTKPFYLSVHEVTQSQYQQVMGANPSRFKGAQNPVEQVSCEDAVEFCRKLSELPEEKAAGRVYRLPTEAEWEFACRAGTTTEFSFEDSKSAMDEYAWYDQNSGLTTHPVGQKYPNSWGLYDMHGNVWEWCSDWYDDYPERAVTDPVGPAHGSDRVFRVFRGGSWCSSARFFRSASRSSSDPSIRYDGLGFRLALSSSGIPQ
jgi:formylglycine-generating enzyme required for sulfatase activity